MTNKVMEDNLHNDKLEEFLKNSFQGYSEEPPGDLWGKIEGGLAPVPVTPVRNIRWWWAAAAAAVVGGLFIGQHLYFSKQLNSLSKQLEQNEVLLRDLGKEQEAGTPIPQKERSSPAHVLENQSIEEENISHQTQQTKPSNPVLKPFYKRKNQKEIQQKNSYNSPQNISNPNTPIAQTNTQGQTAGELADLPPAGVFDQKNDLAVATLPAVANALPDFLPFKNARLTAGQVQPTLHLPSAVAAITPVKKPGNFSIGVHAMPMATWEKITSVRDNMPHQGRKVFRDTTTSTGQSFYAGLAAEYQSSPRFYLGGGIDYHKTAISSRHTADFKLKDGHPHGGGPMGGQHDFRHDFQYDLNTAAGLVEIEVRAEQADTSLDFPDDEEICLNITTQQDLEYLSFPIYGRYEMGNGKWRFYVKGGLVANFLLSNSFDITDIRSENDHFRFERRQQPGGTQQNLQTMSMDYMAGIGVDYFLNNRLKLRVEPNFIGSLTSNHNNPNIQSSQYSAGVNAGLIYVF